MDRKIHRVVSDSWRSWLAMTLVMGSMFAAVIWLSGPSTDGPAVAERSANAAAAKAPPTTIRVFVELD